MNLESTNQPSVMTRCVRRYGASLMLAFRPPSAFAREKSFLAFFAHFHRSEPPRLFSRLFAANQNLRP